MIIFPGHHQPALSADVLRTVPEACHRILRCFTGFWTGFFITDEIFGVSSSRAGKLNPFYTYGTASIADSRLGARYLSWRHSWAPRFRIGSPAHLSVALYGMFLAVIIPPARKDRVIAGLVVIISMLAKLACLP